MSTQIKFGTSGWRAIVAEEFTIANIRRAVTGIPRYVTSQPPNGARVVFDPFWGAARNYPDDLLRDAGIPVTTVHNSRDVLFGGHAPEPDGELLDEARAAMKKVDARIGIATDGDADRFGIVDQDGTF